MNDPRLADPLTLPEVGGIVYSISGPTDYDIGYEAGIRYGGLGRYPLAALLLAALSGFIVGALVMWVVK